MASKPQPKKRPRLVAKTQADAQLPDEQSTADLAAELAANLDAELDASLKPAGEPEAEPEIAPEAAPESKEKPKRGGAKKPPKPLKKGGQAHRLQQANKRLKQAEILLNVSRRVAAMETLDEILETLVEMTTWELGAERGSLFLNDSTTGELYSRVAQGNFSREIRILNTTGVAGAIFTNGVGDIIPDAYADGRFNRTIDEQTGFKTRNIVCAPVKTEKGEIIGV
ncbi:MAG: GAF domain-containing protein, partial [Magnetovibrio sp.]|nr:GAF domain-containing protein [Magnetovibrio sp.]